MPGKLGGARQGAGRKPKSDEIKLIERLDNIIDQDSAIEQLGKLIDKGNQRAIELYFKYRYGLPRQKVDVTSDGEKIAAPTIQLYETGQGEAEQ